MTESRAPRAAPASRGRTAARDEANLAAAWAAFETFRDELNELLCEVRAGDGARAKKLAPAASELARAVSRVADEWSKLNGRMGEGGARDADLSLDLAAARAEVHRRLAQLRDAGG